MSFDTIQWHFYLGYLTLGLMVFRYLWGFVGPATGTLCVHCCRHPAICWNICAMLDNAQPSGTAGHNPLGSMSVILMLLAITAQAVYRTVYRVG